MAEARTDTAATNRAPEGTPLIGEAMRSAFGFDRDDEAWIGMVRESTLPSAGGKLGSYELLEEIGRGAQGAVYKAVQPGTNRIIAVKRVAVGPGAGGHALERFAREVEAASLLSHPGIVTVLGTELVDGRPVLAMEYVEGVPIDRWAAIAMAAPSAGQSALRDVLETFANVCDAVAHAHRRGVLHRDLKPSNILVEKSGRPRVLDFGLAKLTDQPATATGFATHGTGFFGTPAYASPEQVNGEMAKVDTRSDVYSLGVVLYELLTGALPFDTGTGLPALFEQIREGAARPPSALKPDLGREADAIVTKAMAPEPDLRYGSAEELGADVRRLLGGQAVLAHPPSTVYQLRKIVERHRLAFGVGAGGLVLAGVLAVVLAVMAANLAVRGRQLSGALTAAQEARSRAEKESARSATNAEFFREMLASLGRATADRQVQPEQAMVRDTIARLKAGGMEDQPELEVQLWRQVARTALSMGMFTEGEACVERGLARATAALGPEHPDTARCILTRGYVSEIRGDGDGAERDYRRAAEILERTVGEADLDTGLAFSNMGAILRSLGRMEEAEQWTQRTLDMRLRIFGPHHRDVAVSFRQLGGLRMQQRRFGEANECLERALEIVQRVSGSEADTRGIRVMLARVVRNQGRLDEAADMLREIAEGSRNASGEGSLAEAEVLWYLADAEGRNKKFDDAAAHCGAVVSAYRAHYPADHPRIASAVERLGVYLLSAGRADEAEPTLREGLALTETCRPTTARAVKDCRTQLSKCLRALNRADEAAAIDALPEFVPPPASRAPGTGQSEGD